MSRAISVEACARGPVSGWTSSSGWGREVPSCVARVDQLAPTGFQRECFLTLGLVSLGDGSGCPGCSQEGTVLSDKAVQQKARPPMNPLHCVPGDPQAVPGCLLCPWHLSSGVDEGILLAFSFGKMMLAIHRVILFCCPFGFRVCFSLTCKVLPALLLVEVV